MSAANVLVRELNVERAKCVPRFPRMQRLSDLLRDLRWRVCQVHNQLQVRRGQKEDEYDVDEQEEEVSAKRSSVTAQP